MPTSYDKAHHFFSYHCNRQLADITMALYSNSSVGSCLQVTSVNVYYLIANDTADDIIWYVCAPLNAYKELLCPVVTNSFVFILYSFSILFSRDVVQSKLENLGQVIFLSFSVDILT